MNKSILSLTLVLAVAASAAQAERRGVLDRANLNLNAQGSIARQADQRMPEHLVREITRTNAHGETASRNEVITRAGDAGIASRTISGVTADGRSYSGESVVDATANGLTRERNASDSEGNSRSGSANVLIDKEAGKLTKQVNATSTNSDGKSTSLAGESVITRTGDGLVRASNASDSEGNSRSGSANLVIDKEAGTLTKQVDVTRTNSEGESTSVAGESIFTRTDDGFTGETKVSDSQGNTGNRSVDASVNKQDGSISKEVKASGPNGQASTSTVIARNKSAAE